MQKGFSVLIHCSDGWDRTSQVASLSQMCLDSYFRTIEGFAVLIQKEWVYAGHQFEKRNGLARKSNEKETAPVFLQFLDCVHQILHQNPSVFEFNLRFLNELAYHINSCRFGDFLCDSEMVE